MRIFGLPIPFTGEKRKGLNSLPYSSGYRDYWPVVQEPFAGAWQRNLEINVDTAAAYHADFACKTLIARDIAKLPVKLIEKDANGIWSETTNPAYSPVLRQPNPYQTRNQFWESWFLSKLSRGNTYCLKVRDNRNVVIELHVLNPTSVQPLVSDDGSVFYRLATDNLAGLGADITVPAREIIHDRMNCLFHPLVGTPPVFASGLASMLGLNAQKASAILFQNNSTPGGLLMAPGNLQMEEKQRIKEEWEQKFTRINLGRVAILEGGLTYQKMPLTAVETQMIDQLKWSAEVVCSVYHVPGYKIGVGALPSYNNVQSLNVEYYAQAIQSHLEEAEEVVANGLSMSVNMGIEFDTENLLRMDSITQISVIKEGVGAGVLAPDEARAKLGYGPAQGGGGESPYLQQQNYSLAALAKRDAQADPFAPAKPPTPEPVQTADSQDEEPPPDAQKLIVIEQKFTEALRATECIRMKLLH